MSVTVRPLAYDRGSWSSAQWRAVAGQLGDYAAGLIRETKAGRFRIGPHGSRLPGPELVRKMILGDYPGVPPVGPFERASLVIADRARFLEKVAGSAFVGSSYGAALAQDNIALELAREAFRCASRAIELEGKGY